MGRPLTIVLASKEQRMAMIATVEDVAKPELAWINESGNDLDDRCLIILMREKAVGFCVFRRPSSEVRRFFVLPEFRRNKIGSLAIAQLLAIFRNEGHPFITLQYSDLSVAAFLAKALNVYSSFTVEEGLLLVSTNANHGQ
jgi:GNAT superfamily N-acetyltransferase